MPILAGILRVPSFVWLEILVQSPDFNITDYAVLFKLTI